MPVKNLITFAYRNDMDVQTLKLDETGDFGIYTQLADFPLGQCPSYLKEGVGAVCTAGAAVLRVFNTEARLVPGVIVILLPWQLASFKEATDDFGITFFRVSQDMFTDTLSTLWRMMPDFFFYMHKHFAYGPSEENVRRFVNFCDLLALRMKYSPLNCRRESVMQLLRVLYWEVYTVYLNDPQSGRGNYSRKEELGFRFLRLIIEEHAPKELAFYAEKLGISAKYLTTLIRQLSGHSAHDWIVHYTLLEIKSLLRESSLDLKAIAARVNFPDQSSLSRFFRRYTGISPLQYRKTIHF